MNMFTIIYYTSNREEKAFEDKIKANLLKVCGDIPIISVSHKPISLGKNICIGEKEACNHNLFRQIQIGCKLAKTPFVINAEADTLYTPDYFKTTPTKIDQCYKCTHQYMLNKWGEGEYSGYYKKETAPFAQITGRLHFINEIDQVLNGRPLWDKRHKGKRPLELFRRLRWKHFWIKNPIVSIKTGDSMSKHTKIIEPPIDAIKYWGNANKLRERLFK